MSKKTLALQIAVLALTLVVAYLAVDLSIDTYAYIVMPRAMLRPRKIPANYQTIYKLGDGYRLLIPLYCYPNSRMIAFNPHPTGNGKEEWAALVTLSTPDSIAKVKQYYQVKWSHYGTREERSRFFADKIGAPGISLVVNAETPLGTSAWVDILRVAPAERYPVFAAEPIYSRKPPQPGNQETQMIFFIPVVPTK